MSRGRPQRRRQTAADSAETPAPAPAGPALDDAAAVDPGSRARLAGLVVGLLLTALLIALHLEHHASAGPLWRDEANSVNVASLASFADVVAHARYDSFPPLWTSLLHAWMRGLGDGDQAIRRLGLAIGLAALAVLWWAGRRLGTGPPLVALLLFGLSPSVIIYGDSVRGYGLAALGAAWCVGAIWSYVDTPSRRSLAVAQAAALFAVQAHYANCILLLALGIAAAATCLRRERWGAIAGVAALGIVAAASVLWVNRDALEYMSQTAPLVVASWSASFLLEVFANALAPDVPALAAAWAVATAAAVAGIALTLRSPASERDADRALFAAVLLPSALLGYFVALIVAGLGIQYWHYLSLMAVIALADEVGVSLLAARWRGGEWARAGAVALAALLAARDAAAAVPLRMTNVDLAAAEIAQQASAEDLVVVLPWYLGITFDRYYRGAAPWITLPDLDEHRFHRHLSIKERMLQGDRGVDGEIERVERTLRAGGRVWIVGELSAPDPGQEPPRVPPAPEGPRGWHADPYVTAWEMRLGALVERHTRDRFRVPLPDPGRVNTWESVPVGVVRGWR